MAGALLTVLLQKLCPHRFSWPHSVHGQDYQVCLICGSTYEYDWATMRRVRRLDVAPKRAADFQAGLQHGD
jgi:hypothetical protein